MASQAQCGPTVPTQGREASDPLSTLVGPTEGPQGSRARAWPVSKGTRCSAEPELPFSVPSSPRFPSTAWTATPGAPAQSPGPAPPQRHEPLKHLSNWILRIHLNSKSKIWNNEKADTVAQHGFGLTAA